MNVNSTLFIFQTTLLAPKLLAVTYNNCDIVVVIVMYSKPLIS